MGFLCSPITWFHRREESRFFGWTGDVQNLRHFEFWIRTMRTHLIRTMRTHLFIFIKSDRSQKPLSMRTQFAPSNVSKWRTTNKISPRNWASHKSCSYNHSNFDNRLSSRARLSAGSARATIFSWKPFQDCRGLSTSYLVRTDFVWIERNTTIIGKFNSFFQTLMRCFLKSSSLLIVKALSGKCLLRQEYM